MDITEGGTNIPYWMEDPEVKKDWESMLEKEGVPSRMKPEFYEKNYSVRSTSVHPVNRFSRFQTLWPWRNNTSLNIVCFLTKTFGNPDIPVKT